ncbi:hypothetical protein Tco_1458835 [Tanacetum coccineum]
MTPSHFNTYQSSYNNPQFKQQFSPSQSPQYGSIHPTQHYSTTYPSTPYAITYPSTPHPNAYSSTVHQDACPQLQSIPQIEYIISTGKQSSFIAGTSRTRANISGIGGNNSGQQRVVKCFNCQGEGIGILADPGVAEGPVTQTIITQNAAYQADDLDVYDSDYDDFSTAKAVLIANLSSYGSDVLSEVPHSENTHTDMLNQSVQEMLYSKQTHLVNYLENEITSDSNIISYSQYLLETQNAAVYDTNSSTQQDAMILSKAQQTRPMLYDGNVISNETNVISIADSEETLMLEDESRSKMILKQSDPMVLKHKVNIKPVNYAELNRLFEDFGKRFIPQRELSDEQALHPITDQSVSSLVKIEAPRELPKVSLVNTSLKKLKYHLGQFDNVVKKWITPDALTEGEWGV